MAKLRPGEPLSAIQSRDWNRFIDVADWYERFVRLGKPAQIIPHAYAPTTMLVRNNTAGNVAAGAVVEISGTDITTMRRDQMMFNGIARIGVDPFCGVYLEDTPDGAFGRCVVAGAVIAPVDIVDADNTHARIASGMTQFTGDFGGYARILHKPSGTGVLTCVVSLGHTENIVRKARATTTITDGGTGSADVYIAGSSRGNVTVSYDWMTGAGNIASGSDLLIQYFHDQDKWVVIGAECPP